MSREQQDRGRRLVVMLQWKAGLHESIVDGCAVHGVAVRVRVREAQIVSESETVRNQTRVNQYRGLVGVEDAD